MLNGENIGSFQLGSFRRRTTNYFDLYEIVPTLRILRERLKRLKKADTAPIVWQRMSNGYRIASLQEDKFLEALNFIRECFFENEPMCKATGLANDVASMRTFIKIMYMKMSDMQSFCAIREGDGKLVGIAIASINYKGDHVRSETRIRPHQGQALFDIMALKSCVFSKAYPYEKLEIDKFFRVYGFCVAAEHQREGIGTALINCCVERAETLLAPACVAALSSGASRSIARKLQFVPLAKVPYNNFKVYNDKMDSFEYPFEDIPNENDSLACMALTLSAPVPPPPEPLIPTASKKQAKSVRTKLKRK